ncbi:MAG TPA: MFS transporter [Tepidisphaeraceae bacterium]|jgi:MFS family permease
MLHDISISRRAQKAARIATATAFFLDGMTFATWVSRIPAVQERLHLRNATLGVALLMMSLGALLTMPLMGRLVARRGSRVGTVLAVAVFGAALPGPGVATGVITLGLALFAAGVGFGAVNVAANAQAVAVERRYGRPIMGSFHATFSFGGIVGAILGSLAAARAVPPVVHFAVVGMIVVVVAFLLGPVLIQDPPTAVPQAGQSHKGSVFLFLGIIAFCTSMGEGAMSDWSAVFLRQVSRSPASVAALGFAAFSVSMTLGRLLADRVTIALGPAGIVRLGGLLAGTGLFVAMLLPAAATALGGFALVGLGLSALIPTIFSAAGRVPGVAPSVAIATVATTGYFGFLSGPPLIGLSSEVVSLRWAVGLVVIACGVAIALARHVGVQPVANDSMPVERHCTRVNAAAA